MILQIGLKEEINISNNTKKFISDRKNSINDNKIGFNRVNKVAIFLW